MINYIVGDTRNIQNIYLTGEFPKPHLIITSPPYYDVLDYEGTPKQIGYGQIDYEDYLKDVVIALQDCYLLSDDNATLWLIMDTIKRDGRTITLPFDVNSKMQKLYEPGTWILKDVIIWDKVKNLPWNSVGKFRNQFEYVLFYSKKECMTFNIDQIRDVDNLKNWWINYPERYNNLGKSPSNLWSYTTQMRGWGKYKKHHLCPLPFPLIERIITLASNVGDTVLDPFAGSGSVLAIAHEMGRDAYGIDINLSYKFLCEKVIHEYAAHYWINRKKLLKTHSHKIQSFRESNLKLRKLKSLNMLGKGIFDSIHTNIYLVSVDVPDSTCIPFYVVSNEDLTAQVHNYSIETQTHLNGVHVDIQFVFLNEILDFLGIRKLNKYSLSKFHHCLGGVSLDSVVSEEPFMEKVVYSDIELQIVMQTFSPKL
ncbi:MAG: DNA methyltransferase [Candidatus Cloacimonadaceae bacterium]|nr:DNA methyltransferase [Candidatus Cloacimonadaceae bacterium]